jgi:hypothetical protein
MDRDKERAIEWDVQKVLFQYYHHVDLYEYKEAILLFTPDADWMSLGVHLKGQKEILDGLYGGLGAGTIRHILTNTVVTVIDENHATARSYNTLYSSHDLRIDKQKGPIHFEGPNLVLDMMDELERTKEGWRIAKRRGTTIFKRNPEKPAPLQGWAKNKGRPLASET